MCDYDAFEPTLTKRLVILQHYTHFKKVFPVLHSNVRYKCILCEYSVCILGFKICDLRNKTRALCTMPPKVYNAKVRLNNDPKLLPVGYYC